MEFPKGASISKEELARIDAALDAIEIDDHAPRKLTIEVTLHVHKEYPKAVTVGKDEDGAPIQKLARNADEEASLLAGSEPAPEITAEPADKAVA
jgi:hypothetical protein